MHFKALNMKKGLKRIWILGSVFWVLYPFFPPAGYVFGSSLNIESSTQFIIYLIVSQIIWWALLYVGFWIARGFVDDDDKKAGF